MSLSVRQFAWFVLLTVEVRVNTVVRPKKSLGTFR